MKYSDYTNRIQDGHNRRAVYDLVDTFKLQERALTAKVENVSAAKAVYLAVPWTGNIKTIYAVGNGTTLAPTPDIFSFGMNAVAMSGNIITVATGATIATASSVSPTTAKAVVKGQIMRISCNGGSTGPAMNFIFTVLMDITK